MRIAVIVPCFDDGSYLLDAVRSLDEQEATELVVVDDRSTDGPTLAILAELREQGVTVIHHEANQGVASARMTGLAATTARYVFPLDADDLSVPGVLSQMADRLDAAPTAAVCYGDYAEFGDHSLVRAVPDRLDPFRVAFRNEYPVSCLFRREWLERVGGWVAGDYRGRSYEDWNLWMALAVANAPAVYTGPGTVTYRRRMHGESKLAVGRRNHRALYRQLREAHPPLFEQTARHRAQSSLGRMERLLYPIVFGGRRRFELERWFKRGADRLGLSTRRT
jgi:glycosyltransferase involved in cell wall biosynthesis